jgi:hypothetical protein
MDVRPRVVLVAFDGFPLATIGERHTPNLWRLAQHGGWAPDGGRSGLPSTTYPGFTSLLTGCSRSISGVRTTSRKRDAVPGWAGSDSALVPTILHEARDAGLSVGGAFGDHRFQSVVGLGEMDGLWPTCGELDPSVTLDGHGYPVNRAVLPHALALAADPGVDLAFVYFNETDTIGHDRGPEAPETIEAVHEADAALGLLVETLAPDWDRTVLLAASDHDMEARTPGDPIDPTACRDAAVLISDWIADGSAALIRLAIGIDHDTAIESIRNVEGIVGWRSYEPDMLLVLAAPGRVFAGQKIYDGGTHGSRSTARTLAVVGGGHPAVRPLAHAIRNHAPRIRDWAPTLASILGIDLPASDGNDLLAPATGRATPQRVDQADGQARKAS